MSQYTLKWRNTTRPVFTREHEQRGVEYQCVSLFFQLSLVKFIAEVD